MSEINAITRVARDPESLQGEPELNTFDLLRRVFTYAAPYRGKMNALIALVVLRSALLPCLTWAIASVINGPITSGDSRGLWLGTAGYGLLALFTQVMLHFRQRYALELAESVIHDLRDGLFAHLLTLPLAFFDRMKVGRVISRMTSDLEAVRQGVSSIVFVSLVQAGQMFFTALLMLWYDWVLFLVVLAIAPIIWKLNLAFKKRISGQQRRAQESFSRVTATLAESVGGIRVTQGFAREEVNAGFFRELVTDHSKYNMGAARTSAVFLPLLEFNSQIFIAALLALGGYRVLTPGIDTSVGDIVAFFFFANLFFDPIKTLGNQYNNALTAMVGAERVFRLLDTQADWKDAPDAETPADLAGRVEFRDLSFGYDPKRLVLEEVNFTAEPGQTIALVGHTGSGKTSIISLVSKMYLPTRGQVLIDGRDILRLDSRALRRRLGIVHQHSFLFEGTVLDNIRYARPEATVKEAIEATRALDFLDLIEALPHGFKTQVGEGGKNLSSGQRQLISFTRALLADPRILILDEATSAIDAITESRIQTSLTRLLKGRTSFVVAHRLSTIRAADMILVLDHGRIVERGTHEALLASGGIYRGLHDQFVQASAGAQP